MQIIEGNITTPKGFRATGAAIGIKKNGKKDLCLLASDAPATVAGVFTTNVVKAAPVTWDMEIVNSGRPVRGLVVNSGNANACTGQQGADDTQAMAAAFASGLLARADEVSCDSKEERRKQAEKNIEKWVNTSRKHCKYSSLGILLMEMRDSSGIINDHVYTTKDKYGEVYLQIFLLKEYLKIYNEFFKNSSAGTCYTFNIYCIAKTFKIMVLLKKLHEDIQVDFEDSIAETGRLLADNPVLMNMAIKNGLDVNWLMRNQIPDDIDKIEKDLRKRGYLK